MDSLTQITLGAAVGEAVLGRQVGRKATLWGAALGTLPDLDVLANPLLTEVQALAFHRSLTHSLFFIVLASPLIGWALRRFHSGDDVPWIRWVGLAVACLFTHVLLDCLTTYGTQIFWPFSDYPLVLGTIFIIDPLYTVPLAAGLLIGLWWKHTARPRRLANTIGLALSTLYLLVTIGNKLWVEHVFETSLERQGLPHEEVFTKPTAFNNVLWSGIAKAEDGFYVGFYSLLDSDTQVDVRFVPGNHELLGDAWDSPALRELRRFSKGYFTVSRGPDGSLAVHDLRFGRSDLGLTPTGRYIFTFRLTRGPDGSVSGFTRDEPQIDARGELLQRFVRRLGGDEGATRTRF